MTIFSLIQQMQTNVYSIELKKEQQIHQFSSSELIQFQLETCHMCHKQGRNIFLVN